MQKQNRGGEKVENLLRLVEVGKKINSWNQLFGLQPGKAKKFLKNKRVKSVEDNHPIRKTTI